MFYRKFADKGDNQVNNPNIYNVEGDNRLSPSLQQFITRSTTPYKWKCVENKMFFQSVSVIVFSMPEIIL